MKKEFHALAEEIKSFSEGAEIIYIPNPGNLGDGLIRYGTKMFLHHYQLKHTEISIDGRRGRAHLIPYLFPLTRHKVVFLYGGGGAWSRHYDIGYKTYQLLSRFTKNIFVLPSTYDIKPSHISGILYRRDEEESKLRVPDSRFCHDMAFFAALQRDKLEFFRSAVVRDHGNFFRTDLESQYNPSQLPSQNFDISAQGRQLDNVDGFIRTLASCESISTDRLHVAVASIVAKRPVTLYTGNYFKIRAIYNASIASHFPGEVELREHL